MKPANFPGRKNDRRNRAYSRLVAQGTKGKLDQGAFDALSLRVMAALNPGAVAIRSKKPRGARRQAAA